MAILAVVAGGAAYAILLRRYSDFDFSIITVVIGFMVGLAIRTGVGPRASMAYRVLAVVLTYGAIAGAYIAVRAVFLFYDGQPFSLAALRTSHLLVLPIQQAARDRLVGVTYALALIVAWCACGRGVPARSTPVKDAGLPEEQ
jgi:hypothetical protein